MPFFDKKLETAKRKHLEDYQLRRLKIMLQKVMASENFYSRKYRNFGIDIESIKTLHDIKNLPFTDKEEVENDQLEHPPFGTTLTEPLQNYVRYHQTTGTTGKPLKMLDTKESWDWRGKCACYILTAAGVARNDTVLFGFNFGPYTAFWILYEAAYKMGSLVIPTGGWGTEQRLDCMFENDVTVVATTPTYALRLASVAQEKGLDLRNSKVHTLMLTGERGALDPSFRRKIKDGWNAKYFDYVGLTEVGTWGFQCDKSETCIHIMESEFIAEIIDPETGEYVPEGQEGELALTNLGRICNPAIRFRTHDIVKSIPYQCGCGRTFRTLEGGVLKRQDEMVKIRGINIFPSNLGLTVEKYLDSGCEYQIVAFREMGRDDIKILIEKEGDRDYLKKFRNEIQSELKTKFNITLEIETFKKGTLPRYEYKAKRFVDKRHS